LITSLFGVFDLFLLETLPNRIFGVMTNSTLIAVPLFIFMGVLLEKSKVAEELLLKMSYFFSGFRGGLGLSVIFVGALLAASTGIVGATVIAMGLISLPAFLKQGYPHDLSTGLISATGTLGQIIPPSIALVILGDVLSSAYQQSQLSQGIFTAKTISVGDLFLAAIVPGLMLLCFYAIYFLFKSRNLKLISNDDQRSIKVIDLIKVIAPPFILIITVLGSIIFGIASPTEASGLGALGAILIAMLNNKLNFQTLAETVKQSAAITSMVFIILIGASVFSLVFRGLGGEELIEQIFNSIPGGLFGSMVLVMVLIFLLGFILDFIEISFVIVPIVGPVLMAMGADPIWLGIMIAINLQTSFLTPPFGFALFYLRGVMPESIKTISLYKGVIPFIGIQLGLLVLLAIFPSIVSFLPNYL
jgi:tripartite ATP-independent transporter DctM subunit